MGDTRGEHHRVGLYNLLNSLGYTVLAFDYRGFGDSTGTSTDEDTVVEDALAALRWLEDWIKENKPKTQLYVWGHSMGTGIGSSAMARYFRVMGPESRVKGLVLESPYNSFTDEFIYNIEMFPYKRISQLMMHPPQRPSHILSIFNMRFDSDIHILDIGCPVMILPQKTTRSFLSDSERSSMLVLRTMGRRMWSSTGLPRSLDINTVISTKHQICRISLNHF